MNMDKYFIWIHYERLHNHNKAKHNNTVCIFLGMYCKLDCGRDVHQKQLSFLLLVTVLGQWEPVLSGCYDDKGLFVAELNHFN